MAVRTSLASEMPGSGSGEPNAAASCAEQSLLRFAYALFAVSKLLLGGSLGFGRISLPLLQTALARFQLGRSLLETFHILPERGFRVM